MSKHPTANGRGGIEKTKLEFRKTWAKLLDDLSKDPNLKGVRSSVDRFVQVLEKNVPHGKQTRAYLSVYMYKSLKPSHTEEDDFLNYISGWIIEILQAGALIADDIMDRSETRRGISCWYKNPDVGMKAVNDAFLMDHFVYYIMLKYFSGKDYMLKLLECYQYNNLYTVLGESLDLKTANEGTANFSTFTEPTYKALVKYKTSYYTFHWPVANALIRAGIQDEGHHGAVEKITLKIGELFQVQDDFLDCYGDPKIMGKVGTDIRDGKLTWLIVKALNLASESQIKRLQTHYGQPPRMAECEVKRIYDELGIEEAFYKHEDATRLEIVADIKALPHIIPQEPFLNVLDAIYRRDK